jgi:hypothetical protein
MSVDILCGKRQKIRMNPQSCGGRGRASTGEIFVSLKASMGMLAADGDESAMAALFLCESA